jgi:hypothetical protein
MSPVATFSPSVRSAGVPPTAAARAPSCAAALVMLTAWKYRPAWTISMSVNRNAGVAMTNSVVADPASPPSRRRCITARC